MLSRVSYPRSKDPRFDGLIWTGINSLMNYLLCIECAYISRTYIILHHFPLCDEIHLYWIFESTYLLVGLARAISKFVIKKNIVPEAHHQNHNNDFFNILVKECNGNDQTNESEKEAAYEQRRKS